MYASLISNSNYVELLSYIKMIKDLMKFTPNYFHSRDRYVIYVLGQ